MSKGSWGGRRFGAGSKQDPQLRARLEQLSLQKLEDISLDYDFLSVENMMKAMNEVMHLVLMNNIDGSRASLFNSLVRTHIEMLIPTEFELKVRALEEETNRIKEQLRARRQAEMEKRNRETIHFKNMRQNSG